MKRLLSCITVLSVMLLMALPADAGIIITEGKVAKSSTTKRIKRRTTPVVFVLGALQVNPEEVLGDGDSETELEDTDEQPIADLDENDPDGWDCQDLGGGVEYCEPEEDNEGAGTGAAGGGGVGEDTDMVFAGETELAGCQGSSDGPVGLLGALAALLVMMAARRRVVPQS